jgi:membrane dipeptidase
MALTRRDFLCRTAGAAALAVPRAGLPESAFHTPEAAETLYQKSISGDSLVYTEDYSSNLDTLTLDAIRDSGMTYAFYDVSITPRGRSFDDCIRSLALWNESIARSKDLLMRADCARDILTAKKTGKHALVYLFQDAYPLERDLHRLRLFHDLGVRVIQLTHNSRNLVGDGYVDRVNGGLSDFGLQVVEAMNELRILIDLSHCGEQTTFDAIRFSKRPCAFTHAGCRALLSTERNKTDAQLRALADKGGVIGIFNMTCWLTDRDTATLDAVTGHIKHAVRLAGIDHVGFGSDGPMGGVQRLAEELAGHVQFFQSATSRTIYTRRPSHVRVPELNQPRRLVVLADALSRRGFTQAEIDKIIGGNFFRLFREVVG